MADANGMARQQVASVIQFPGATASLFAVSGIQSLQTLPKRTA